MYKINNTNNSDLIKSVSFSYDNSLCRYTPNSTGNNQGKLTLTKVEFRGNDDELIMPPYEFEYGNDDPYGSGLNPDYNAEDWDRWG